MAEPKKKLTMAEMLAAARKTDGGGSPAETPKPEEAAAPAEPAAESPAAESPAEAPAAEKPAPKAPAAKPAGGKMSMAEMLAAARTAGGGAKPAAAKPAAEKPAAEKPAAAPKAAPKAEAKPAAKKAVEATEKDTGSFLTGGPKKDRAGPMSKAEAESKGQPAPAKPVKTKPVAPPMPEKPAYAKAKPGEPVDQGRRGVLVFVSASMAILVNSFLGLGFSTMSATFGLWGLALTRFMFPNVRREPPSQFKVGSPTEFPFGQVQEKFKAEFGVWIVNYEYNGAHQIFALSTVCTHLGCTPNWLEAEQKFK